MTYPIRAALLAALLVPLLVAGCAEDATYADASYADAQDTAMAAEEAEADGAVPTVAVAQTDVQTDAPAPAEARQLRRTASLRIRATDHARGVERARALAEAADAFVGDEQSQRYDSRVETTLTLRVPAAGFDALLDGLSGLPGEVESRSVTVDDVTRQIADTGARLETKRLAEAQLRTLLGRAGSIEDVLAVQTRLQTVREEIESTEAQLRVLRDEVALSTITVTLFEASAAGITAGPGFFAQAGRALAVGWDGAVTFVLGLLTLWPFLLAVGGLVWAARRWRRRRIAGV